MISQKVLKVLEGFLANEFHIKINAVRKIVMKNSS